MILQYIFIEKEIKANINFGVYLKLDLNDKKRLK